MEKLTENQNRIIGIKDIIAFGKGLFLLLGIILDKMLNSFPSKHDSKSIYINKQHCN